MMENIADQAAKARMMKMAESKMQGDETRANIQLCIMVSANRDKMTDGPSASASSMAIVQQTDRIMLKYFNSLQEEGGA